MSMDCDRIATLYKFLEQLAFGRRLQKHRTHYLNAARGCRSALILGDGDGRFLVELLSRFPELSVTAIEKSSKMLALTSRRIEDCLTQNDCHVELRLSDARTERIPDRRYDLVFTHFFLDCFSENEVEAIVRKVKGGIQDNAQWIVSEFHRPAYGWRSVHAQVWLRAMYFFFRIATGLKTSRLPDYRQILSAAGFSLVETWNSMADLICSERWQYHSQNPTSGYSDAQSLPKQ